MDPRYNTYVWPIEPTNTAERTESADSDSHGISVECQMTATNADPKAICRLVGLK